MTSIDEDRFGEIINFVADWIPRNVPNPGFDDLLALWLQPNSVLLNKYKVCFINVCLVGK